jgi:hypothetical protein
MNFYFWDNQGRLFPHMRNAVCNALKSPNTENFEGVISEVLSTSQSQQYLFAKDVLFHDANAFSQYLSELLRRQDGKHVFDDQECAFFLSQLFHLRGYRGEQPIELINEAIVSILDGYTGNRNIFTARGLNDFDSIADRYKLESVDSSLCRYFKRIKNHDINELLAKKVESLFVGYHLPETMRFWTYELSKQEQSSYAYRHRTKEFVDFLSGQDALDAVYMNQLVESLGLDVLLSHLDEVMDSRSIAQDVLLLCHLYGEDNIITDDRLNNWQKKVSYCQATKTLSVLASTPIDWSSSPNLLSFVIKNMKFYHQDFLGFFPDDSLLLGAIKHNLANEFVSALLMTTVDPLLSDSDLSKIELSTLLEGVISNAEGGVAPAFRAHYRSYVSLIGRAFSANGAEHMPEYVNDLSAPGKQFLFGFLTHEHTNRGALFERFPDAKRATLSSEMGL